MAASEIETPALPPPELTALVQRAHARVVIPAEVTVYARVRARGSSFGQLRGVVTDVSAAGLAVRLIEGGRFDPPHEKEEVTVELEYEGYLATVHGWVVRAGGQTLHVRFQHSPAHDDEVDGPLLSLLIQVVARRIDRVDRRRFAALAHPPLHEHFYGAAHLHIRVQAEPPRWWQMVFLDFVVAWSDAGGLETALIDRAAAGAREVDPVDMRAHLVRHERPWRSLRKLAQQITLHAMAAQPGHADELGLVQRALTQEIVQ